MLLEAAQQVRVIHMRCTFLGGEQCRCVYDRSDGCRREPDRDARKLAQVCAGNVDRIGHIHLEQPHALFQTWQAELTGAIETSFATKRGIQVLRMIGRAHDDDAFASIEPVELLEKRIDDAIVLRFRETSGRGRGAPADAVHLIDEDDARRVFARELEQPLDATHAHPDELVGEIAAGHGDEAGSALAGQRACE
jgi:hypothetical protein